MKRGLLFIGFMLALLCTTSDLTAQSIAQDTSEEMTKEEKKAAKIAEKENKRRAKEEAKEAEDLEKLEKAEAKAVRKQENRDKRQARFDEFLEKWEPVDISDIDESKMPSTVEFFKGSNELFTTMKEVEEYIGFIQIETLPENEEGIVEMKVSNKNTGEEIQKSDALATYSKATLDLTTAALQATSVALNGTAALTEMAINPLSALTMGKKIKNTLDAVKYSIDVIPLIQAKIKDNSEALQQSKNN